MKKVQFIKKTENFSLTLEYLNESLPNLIYFGWSPRTSSDSDTIHVELLLLEGGKLIWKHAHFYEEYDMYSDYSKQEREDFTTFVNSEKVKGLFNLINNTNPIRGFRKDVDFTFRNNGWFIESQEAADYHFLAFTTNALLPYFYNSPLGLSPKSESLISDFKKTHYLHTLNREERAFFSALASPKINYCKDWLNAISYLKYLDHQIFNWSEYEEHDCLVSLWRFRLAYIKEKIVNKNLESLTSDSPHIENPLEYFVQKTFEKDHTTNLIDSLSNYIGEDLREVFTNLETINSDLIPKNNLEDLSEYDYLYLFAYPKLINFSDEEDTKIQNQILKMNYQETLRNAANIYCYLANYLEFSDQKPYSKILDLAFNIIKMDVPFNFYWLDEDYADLFWLASEVINEYWKILPNNKQLEDDLRKRIYKAYWPKVGDIWPIDNYYAIHFRSEGRQRIFDEALGWIMCLDDFPIRNPKLNKYLHSLAEKIEFTYQNNNYPSSVLGRVFEIQQKDTNKATRFELAERSNLTNILFCPKTTEEAEILLNNWLDTDCEYIENLTRLAISPKPKKVGTYIINYLIKNFKHFKHPSDAITVFTALCTGASEEDEVIPLEKLAKKIKSSKNLENSRKITTVIDDALNIVKKNLSTINFQRKHL